MFWTYEDLQEVELVIDKVLGPQGNILEKDVNETLHNVVVWNKSLGKLWYGDISSIDELQEKCLTLSKSISKEICVSFMDSDTFFTTPKFVFTQL